MNESKWLKKGRLTRRQFLRAAGLAAGVVALGPRLLRAEETIKLGIIGPEAIFVGKGIKYGAQLAAEEINAAGGVLGKNIELVFRDTKMIPEVGVTAAQDLVLTEGVKAIIGEFRSEVVVAISTQIPKLRVPFLITAATEPAPTNLVASNYDKFKYIFRPMLNGMFLGANLLEFAGEFLAGGLLAKGLLRNNKVAIVAENLIWIEPIAAALEANLSKFGFNVVAPFPPLPTIRIPVGETNFSPYLTGIKDEDAAITLMIFSDPSMVPFVVGWARAQIPTALFGIHAPFHAPTTCQGIGGLAAGIVEMEIAGVKTAITPKTEPFFDAYMAKFGEDPVYSSFITYDSVYIIKDAIERAGTTDADALVTALEGTNWTGASGIVQFYGENPAAEDPKYGPLASRHDSKYGRNLIYPVQVQIREGCKKEVIWPADRKTADYVKPPWVP